MADDIDPLVQRQFRVIADVAVPDVWSRVSGQPLRTRPAGRPRRTMTGVAAAVLIVAGAGGVSMMVRSRGSTTSAPATATATATTGPPESPPPTSSTGEPSTEGELFGTATLDHDVVGRGWDVTITPSGEIQPICTELAVVRTSGALGFDPVAQLTTDGRAIAYEATSPTWPACLPERSSASATYRVPDFLADGTYVLCITEDMDEAGCATLRIAADVTTTEPTPTQPSQITDPAAPFDFPALVLASPPPGYTFDWARYDDQSQPAVGMVRYTGSTGGPDLVIILRPTSEFLDVPFDLGRRTWQVGELTVIDDTQGGACEPDYCSVGVLWDGNAAVSVTWWSTDGAPLGSEHTQEALVALVGELTVVDPSTFVPGAFFPWEGA